MVTSASPQSASLDRVALEVGEVAVLVDQLRDDAVVLVGDQDRVHVRRRPHVHDGERARAAESRSALPLTLQRNWTAVLGRGGRAAHASVRTPSDFEQSEPGSTVTLTYLAS